MKVIIVEDEKLAADRLIALLKECKPSVQVMGQFDSVEDTLSFYRSGAQSDLLLLDIQLADGKSFEIFDRLQLNTPVVFVTAYDQYALQAFRHFSVDYLLKPVQAPELNRALNKAEKFLSPTSPHDQLSSLKKWLDKNERSYKERLIVKTGHKIRYKPVEEVSYFFAEGKDAYLVSKGESRQYLIDYTLEELENNLDPKRFFRINRKYIVQVDVIEEVRGLINRTMEVRLNQPARHTLTVSRDKSQHFRKWLDR